MLKRNSPVAPPGVNTLPIAYPARSHGSSQEDNITDDFHSAGRISGAERLPINELQVGKFHTVEGRRLQVNASAARYKRQLSYLASMI
jgi:hypothetical protein